MLSRLAPVLAAVALAACATARETPPDANIPVATDARPPRDAAISADAASSGQAVDAAFDAAPDAPPASSGCTQPYSGVLATWSFAGAAGTQASTAVATTAPGVTGGAVTRAGVTATAGTNSINSTGWSTQATRDVAKYYTLTIAPPAGCTLSLSSASIDGRASGTGPAAASIATSVDAFTQTSTVSTTAASTPALAVAGAGSAVEVRIYGFSATSSSGTFRLAGSVSLSGTIQ